MGDNLFSAQNIWFSPAVNPTCLGDRLRKRVRFTAPLTQPFQTRNKSNVCSRCPPLPPSQGPPEASLFPLPSRRPRPPSPPGERPTASRHQGAAGGQTNQSPPPGEMVPSLQWARRAALGFHLNRGGGGGRWRAANDGIHEFINASGFDFRFKNEKNPTHPPTFSDFLNIFCCCLKGRPCLKTHFSPQNRLNTGLEEHGIASAILFQTHISVKTHPLKTWKICPQITFSPKFLPDPPCDRWSWRKRRVRKRRVMKRQELAWTEN